MGVKVLGEIVTLKTVDIKSLSRKQLESAYLRLLKVSEMKTGLIQFLGSKDIAIEQALPVKTSKQPFRITTKR